MPFPYARRRRPGRFFASRFPQHPASELVIENVIAADAAATSAIATFNQEIILNPTTTPIGWMIDGSPPSSIAQLSPTQIVLFGVNATTGAAVVLPTTPLVVSLANVQMTSFNSSIP